MPKYKFKKAGADDGKNAAKPEGPKGEGEKTAKEKVDLGKSKSAAKAAKRYGKKEVAKG